MKLKKNFGEEKFIRYLSKLPVIVLKPTFGLIRFLDNIGKLPKSIIDISPFHATAFITNVGSIGLSTIYHHIYDFGTISLFVSIGRKKESFKMVGNKIVKSKVVEIGLVADERICDGYYFSKALKEFINLTRNPEKLKEELEKTVLEKDTENEV